MCDIRVRRPNNGTGLKGDVFLHWQNRDKRKKRTRDMHFSVLIKETRCAGAARRPRRGLRVAMRCGSLGCVQVPRKETDVYLLRCGGQFLC